MSVEQRIELIPSLQLMAIEILIRCCEMSDCRKCQFRQDEQCLIGTHFTKKYEEKEKVDIFL